MPQTDTRSLQQIKRETEQTRAGLTDTVEQLKTSVADTAADIRHRISPDAIKAEVSDYIKSRGEQLVNDVTAAARRNPIQAVAVGASLAYPLLRLARSIPVPVLMVGAGLFLAGSKTGQAVTQKASDIAADLSEDVMRRAHDFGDQVEDSASAAKAYASDQFDRVTSAISGGASQVGRSADATGAALASNSRTLQEKAASLQDKAVSLGGSVADRAQNLRDQGARMAGSAAAAVQDTAASLGDTLASRANDLKDQGLRMASSAGSTVQDLASGASSAARNAAANAADVGLDAARAVRDRASDLTDRAGKTIFQTIEQNPLLVAGVGLFIGGLIASALPRSDIEDGLVGGASNAVKRRAQDAAIQGLDAAKNAAGEVYAQTSRMAEAEGLTSEGIGKAAQDITQRARRVAESAVTTAFEPPQENHQPRNYGDTKNG
jgi:hypothetical protein